MKGHCLFHLLGLKSFEPNAVHREERIPPGKPLPEGAERSDDSISNRDVINNNRYKLNSTFKL